MESFFDNLFGKKPVPPEIQKGNEPVQQNELPSEDDDLYKKGDLIGGEHEVRGTLGKGGFGMFGDGCVSAVNSAFSSSAGSEIFVENFPECEKLRGSGIF